MLVVIRLRETKHGLQIQWGQHVTQHRLESAEAWLALDRGRRGRRIEASVRGLLGEGWEVWAVQTPNVLEGLDCRGCRDYYAVKVLGE